MDDTTVPPGSPTDPRPDGDDPMTPTDPGARVDALIARLQNERLEVLPFYHDLRNQIVRPHNLHVETRYFFRTWKPLLGPVLTLLIMELRDRCYYNPRTGERRDYCWPSQEELARALGVSVRTIIRALQSPLARKFIRVQHRYRYDPALEKKVRTSSAYVVAMDDPLRPEDEPVLTRMVAEQILADETARRHDLQVASPADLDATLADRSHPEPSTHLPDNLPVSRGPGQTDNLSDINIAAKMSVEEVPSRRDSHEKKIRRTTPPRVDSATRTDLLPDAIVQAYADANSRQPTPLERQRLLELIRRFDEVARQARPPSSGAGWVLAAIVEAVDSGSAFVAPRRIATICERWQRAESGERRRRSADHGSPSPDRRVPRLATDEGDVETVDATEETPVDPYDESPDLVPTTFAVSASRPITNWQLWRLVTDDLLRRPGVEQHRVWLTQAGLIGQEDGALVVGTPSRFARDLLERRFADGIAEAIARVLGEHRAVRFVVTRSWLEESRG